ncbi:MAG: hypothetical protein U1F42_01505 [Candidatus Competibacteraceae bacterium]
MYKEEPTRKLITVTTLAKMKRDRERFLVLTAYDAILRACSKRRGGGYSGRRLAGMVIQGRKDYRISHDGRHDLSHPGRGARLPHGAVDGGHAFRQLHHG